MWSYVVDVVAEGGDLPNDESHPFWSAMDRFVSVMQACGVTVRTYAHPPDWALSYYGEGAVAPDPVAMADVLQLLTWARRAQPSSKWTVMFDGGNLLWSDEQGYLTHP